MCDTSRWSSSATDVGDLLEDGASYQMPPFRFRTALRALCSSAVLHVAGASLALAQTPPSGADPSRMPPLGWVSSPKPFEAIKIATDLMIPTRDGKRMAICGVSADIAG